MKTFTVAPIASLLLLTSPGFPLHAQLVADGGTVAINAISTNLTGDLIIGTNGSFTTLMVTNTGSLTNTGNGIIGLNASARTNHVIVTGDGSFWGAGGNLNLGTLGSHGRLTVTNGGRVNVNNGNMALNGGVGNVAVVAGANSVWTNRGNLNIGNSGSFNQVLVTDSATVGASGKVSIGNTGSSSNQLLVAGGSRLRSDSGTLGLNGVVRGNVAVITDPGSRWTMSLALDVGPNGAFNQLFITNGAKVFSGGAYIGANVTISGSGLTNVAILAGAGSTWTNTGASAVGNIGSFNQLIVSNGAVMRNTTGGTHTIGSSSSGSNNTMLVTGAGSLFSNRDALAQLNVGASGSFNEMSVRNGAVAETDTVTLGSSSTSMNNLMVVTDPGSTLVSSRAVNVGSSGSFNHLVVTNGGTLTATNLFIGFNASSSNNLVTVTAGNLFVTNASGTAIFDVRRGASVLNSGSLKANRLLLTNGAQSQFTLNGGILRTRNTTVSNGSAFIVGDGVSFAYLDLQGNGTHQFNDGLRIAQNGSLSGNGAVVGNVTNEAGGLIAPGLSIAKLTFSNPPHWQGIIRMEVARDGASLTNDQIEVAGPLVYGGWLAVDNLGPDVFAAGDNFKLFSATSYSGSFSGLNLPDLPAGLNWKNKLLVDGSIEVVPWAGPILNGTIVGTNLVFDLTEGVPGWSYELLVTPDLANPNWTVVASGAFDWMGVATSLVNLDPSAPMRFFRLRALAPL